MRATFYGFEMAKSALAASQRNIDTTGQNISNINTLGYSRQRVNLSAVGSGNLNWRYVIQPSENVGLGVDMDGIQRIRDEFLDVRYWKENSDYNRFALKGETLSSVESFLDEFLVENVYGTLNNFSDALQELSMNSDEVEYASSARTAATTLARTLNKAAEDIGNIKVIQLEQLTLIKDGVNQIAKSIDSLNREIVAQKLLGPVSNELLDQRNLLLDELSAYGNVSIRRESMETDTGEEVDTGGISVFFGLGSAEFDHGALLVDGTLEDMNLETEGFYNTLEFDSESSDPYRLTWETGDNSGSDLSFTSGQVFACYEMLNGTGDVDEAGERLDIATKGIPYFMNILNDFAYTFADTFNDLNYLDNLFESTDGEEIQAYNIRISDNWREDPLYIARTTNDADTPNDAENDNVLRMIDALKREDREMEHGFVGSFIQYVGYLNSEIMDEVSYNNTQIAMSDNLVLTISNLRDSVMSVSEDEEAMNLMKFQKSYTAAARLMTVLDEMVDTVVNRLGIVGR